MRYERQSGASRDHDESACCGGGWLCVGAEVGNAVVDECVPARVLERRESRRDGQEPHLPVCGRSDAPQSEVTLAKGTKAWFNEARIHRSKSVSTRHKVLEDGKPFYVLFLFGCENWSWSVERLNTWET